MRTFAVVLLVVVLAVACGPSEEEISRVADQRVSAALAAIPTPTPVQFPTPLPTATPMPTPTPIDLLGLQQRFSREIGDAILGIPSPPTATPQSIVDWNAVYQRVVYSVFYIGTPSGQGSGWLFAPGLILTARHVVGFSNSVTVRYSGTPFVATVLASDSQRDIALLKFDPIAAKLPAHVVPLALGEVSTADNASPMMLLGYFDRGISSAGTVGAASARVGTLSQHIDVGSLGTNLMLDVLANEGNSGGPVFNNKGLVVGIVRASDESSKVVYAVHEDEIRKALPSLQQGLSR